MSAKKFARFLRVEQGGAALHESGLCWSADAIAWSEFKLPMKQVDVTKPIVFVCQETPDEDKKKRFLVGKLELSFPALLYVAPDTK